MHPAMSYELAKAHAPDLRQQAQRDVLPRAARRAAPGRAGAHSADRGRRPVRGTVRVRAAANGVKVVFFGRFAAVLRTYAAFLAGLSRMRWSRFPLANAAGGVLWSGLYAFGAYALGSAASSIGSAITIVGGAVAGALTAATIVIGRRSLRRLEQRAEDAFPDYPTLSPRPAGGMTCHTIPMSGPLT